MAWAPIRPARPPRSARQPATDRNAGDGRRGAHNPEVAGSNPAPATKCAGQRPLPVTEGAFLLPLVNVFVNEVGGDPCAESLRGLLTGTPDSRLVLVILAANLACKLVATLNNCVSRRSPGSAHRPLCGRGSGKPAGRWAPGRLSPATAHQIRDLSQYVAPVRSAASVLL